MPKGKTGPKVSGENSGRPGAPNSRSQAAKDAGLSKDEQKRATRVANVPEVELPLPHLTKRQPCSMLDP